MPSSLQHIHSQGWAISDDLCYLDAYIHAYTVHSQGWAISDDLGCLSCGSHFYMHIHRHILPSSHMLCCVLQIKVTGALTEAGIRSSFSQDSLNAELVKKVIYTYIHQYVVWTLHTYIHQYVVWTLHTYIHQYVVWTLHPYIYSLDAELVNKVICIHIYVYTYMCLLCAQGASCTDEFTSRCILEFFLFVVPASKATCLEVDSHT
jgi:hypothetical protein